MEIHPLLFQIFDPAPVKEFIAEWQEAVDTADADLFNNRFSQDILWGSPFGAIAGGYEQIHSIHRKMFSLAHPQRGAAKFIAEHICFLSEQIAIAYVRRVGEPKKLPDAGITPGSFDELALLVLVERNGRWWLAAAQHVPDQRDVYRDAINY
ncbi:YybH family protein [Chitinophaga sp. 22321]|uniref:DUF4440 domain-containing protein n=1 Tax=Chitinophaga hostae TaxID=2831022 RepID=A0ABS5J7I2_9BACT|nr:DUF4440 domain-containing protein [Chitinophaga hostae]MBS0030527.1 DUF4440 domain-containing protein [Chitinophaga hostae]